MELLSRWWARVDQSRQRKPPETPPIEWTFDLVVPVADQRGWRVRGVLIFNPEGVRKDPDTMTALLRLREIIERTNAADAQPTPPPNPI